MNKSYTPRTNAVYRNTVLDFGHSASLSRVTVLAEALETELTAALAERDEARRLLGEADEAITLLIRHDDIESREHAQALNKALNAQTHITNHLTTA